MAPGQIVTSHYAGDAFLCHGAFALSMPAPSTASSRGNGGQPALLTRDVPTLPALIL
jgi:hypothetical protein